MFLFVKYILLFSILFAHHILSKIYKFQIYIVLDKLIADESTALSLYNTRKETEL